MTTKKKRTFHSPEFKAEALKLAEKTGVPSAANRKNEVNPLSCCASISASKVVIINRVPCRYKIGNRSEFVGEFCNSPLHTIGCSYTRRLWRCLIFEGVFYIVPKCQIHSHTPAETSAWDSTQEVPRRSRVWPNKSCTTLLRRLDD